MMITLTACLPRNFDESFDYFDKTLRHFGFVPVNPHTGLSHTFEASENGTVSELVLLPEQVIPMVRENTIAFLHYWRQAEDVSLSWKKRGTWWEFQVGKDGHGSGDQWHRSMTFLQVVQHVVQDSIKNFGVNIDDKPIICLDFD